MRLIAHRGFASVNPENTVRAVRAAAATADAVEVDARRCGSGELVVIHDETVDRVTDGTGAVADLPIADLRALDVLDTGAGVPTLAAVLEAVPADTAVNVELKESGLAADAAALARGTDGGVFVSSFLPSELDACRRADPDLPRALLVGEDADPREAVTRAGGLDCAFLHPHRGLCDERLVTESHRAGMEVNAWTVDARAVAAELAAVGVEGVIADRPDVL